MRFNACTCGRDAYPNVVASFQAVGASSATGQIKSPAADSHRGSRFSGRSAGPGNFESPRAIFKDPRASFKGPRGTFTDRLGTFKAPGRTFKGGRASFKCPCTRFRSPRTPYKRPAGTVKRDRVPFKVFWVTTDVLGGIDRHSSVQMNVLARPPFAEWGTSSLPFPAIQL